MKLSVYKGDIIHASADAVVLPANEKLKEGSGASSAIFAAAGRTRLTEACRKIGHCNVGNAVPTPAFGLNANFIIHTVVPAWIDGEHDEYGLLSSAYYSALELADIMNCESIAFPLLASGNNKFSKQLAFQIAKESIERFEGKHLKKVIMIVYDDNSENLVKLQGYNVEILETKPKTAHIAHEIIADGLKIGLEWMKDIHHQKMIIDLGINLALRIVSNSTKKKVLNLIDSDKK